MCAVFGDAAIADLAIAELAFDDAKHVFDLRAHFAEAAVASGLPLREIAARLRLFLHDPQHAGAFRRALLFIARIALVAVHGAVVFADEIDQHLRVVNFARRHTCCVHETALRIDANVRLHAEIPLVSLLRRRHLGIAPLLFVLRRG